MGPGGASRRLVTTALAVLLGVGLTAPAALASSGAEAVPVSVTTVAEAVVRDELRRGESTADVQLVSPGGRYSLELVVDPSRANTIDPVLGIVSPATRFGPAYLVADTGFCGIYACVLTLREDGSLVATGRTYERVFSPAEAGADRLVLTDEGRLLLYAGPAVVAAFDAGAAPRAELRRGGQLLPGERLVGADGTQLVMQTDGNLVVYLDGVARWSSRTSVPGSAFVRQTDGNGVVYTPDLRPVFATGTVGSLGGSQYQGREAGLVLPVAGAMVLTGDPTGAGSSPTVWSSAWSVPTVQPGEVLRAGDRRTAPGGRVVTVLQGDGNLVTYRDGRAVWASRTAGVDVAVMQGDGNLVLYREVRGSTGTVTALSAVWSTRTAGNPGARFVTQDDGNAVVYSRTDRPLFSAR
ncbi:hypothetical protein [Aquipuribacter hungaricus]|uniref:Bulb-type lectin domain-containing protein n=1 Tax=Aquipuribacter hungaricus TaxID=545624 RepID=A0ABV7WGL4_9MICO